MGEQTSWIYRGLHFVNKILEKLPKAKRVLLIGTGGGSDIFSCLLVADILVRTNPDIYIDIAGMLSPASLHTYTYRHSEEVTFIENPMTFFYPTTKIKRTLEDKNKTEISFVDNHFWNAIFEMNLEHDIGDVFHLSCRYGTQRLVDAMRDWCAIRQYDYVLGVDVGGDILAPKTCKTILSPIMDWTTLFVLKSLKTPSYILEFGYGLDGEAEGSIYENCPYLNGYPIVKDFMNNVEGWNYCFDNFQGMYHNVMKPVRSGHTVPLFLEKSKMDIDEFLTEKKTFDIPHIYKYRLGGEVIITDKFVRKGVHHPLEAFLIQIKHVPNKTKGYLTVVEMVQDIKRINPFASTELDGHISQTHDGEYVLAAHLSKRLPEAEIEKFIEKANTLLGKGIDYISTDRNIISQGIRRYYTIKNWE